MAIYHCSTKPISRSAGRSAVAAAAYRTATRLRDERQGIEHNYAQRSGVESTELVLPRNAGRPWNREQLWNAAETAEKRKDARTAREWEVALPAELPFWMRRNLAAKLAYHLAHRYGCAVDVAIHAPDREGDQRNHHAHLLATTRKVTATGLGEKCKLELSDAKRLSLGLEPARTEVEAVREVWAQEVNRSLAIWNRVWRSPEQEPAAPVDHRSLARQRADTERRHQPEQREALQRTPQIKLGWKVVAMERRGIPTDRGRQLRQIQADNEQRRATVIEITTLRQQQRDQQAAQQQQERERQRRQQEEQRRQEAERQQQAERQKQIQAVEEQLRGKSRHLQEVVIGNWRNSANAGIPKVAEARRLWEQDPYNPDARAWRTARDTVGQHAATVAQYDREIADWHKRHSLQSRLLSYGVRSMPRELQQLTEERRRSAQHLQESQNTFQHWNRAWDERQAEYEAHLRWRGDSVRQAQEYLKTLEQNKEHFDRFRAREAQAAERQREIERQRQRTRDYGRSM